MKKIILLATILIGLESHSAISPADKARFFDLSYQNMAAPSSAQVSPMYQHPYANLIDFAKLEAEKPLTKNFLKGLTVEDLMSMDQEMSDQLYARLTAGPIPDGVYDGTAKILDGSPFKSIVKFFTREDERGTIVNVMNRLGITAFDSDSVAKMLSNLANTMWKGKHFYKNEKVLRNVIPENERAGKALGLLVKGFDYKTLRAQPVQIQNATVQAWELFPAKLYCGQSLTDSRRESVIIDYAYSDKLPGYQDKIDFLASRHGLYVRDEVRMVRPGLYLGKAYLGRVFFLNFVLYNKAEDEKNRNSDWAGLQECWTGTQKRSAL